MTLGQKAFILYEEYGLRTSVIAERLGSSEQSIGVLISRIRKERGLPPVRSKRKRKLIGFAGRDDDNWQSLGEVSASVLEGIS